MRLSRHPLLSWLGAAYVEVFRNTPLVIQLLAIYLLVTELLPEASRAIAVDGVALLSKEGLQIAVPESGGLALGCALVAVVAAARPHGRGAALAEVGAGLIGVAAARLRR